MYLYWHIQQDLNFLGEFILFHDPVMIQSFKKWVRKNAAGLAMAENINGTDLKRMFINPN